MRYHFTNQQLSHSIFCNHRHDRQNEKIRGNFMLQFFFIFMISIFRKQKLHHLPYGLQFALIKCALLFHYNQQLSHDILLNYIQYMTLDSQNEETLR